MRTIRKLAVLLMTAVLLGLFGGCTAERTFDFYAGDLSIPQPVFGEIPREDILVGISMPTRSLERWNNDGQNVQNLLQAMGFRTSLQYADNRVDLQISQIQNMINDRARIMVIAPIDGTALSPVLQVAADRGIVVVSYDRLINDSPNVDYYATFDNELVGQKQGEFIVEQLGLDQGATGPFNIELFAGSPDDNNARFFFKGAYDVLKPYLDSGVLVSPSGKVPTSVDHWTQVGIQGWASATAQNEMENRINSFYGGGKRVDVVLSPNDSLALGITQALLGAGYQPGADFPILTGQDADVANVQNIIDGTQSMTVWKDTRTLGEQVAVMVSQIADGVEVEVNDTETYDNGVRIVPAFLLDPVVVVRDDIQEYLINSGFLRSDQIHGL